MSPGFLGAGRYNHRIVAVKQIITGADFAVKDRETLLRLKQVLYNGKLAEGGLIDERFCSWRRSSSTTWPRFTGLALTGATGS